MFDSLCDERGIVVDNGGKRQLEASRWRRQGEVKAAADQRRPAEIKAAADRRRPEEIKAAADLRRAEENKAGADLTSTRSRSTSAGTSDGGKTASTVSLARSRRFAQRQRAAEHSAAWEAYRQVPCQASSLLDTSGFNDAGVQRIDLKGYDGQDFDKVATFVDSFAEDYGFGPLLPFQRIGTADRLAAWRDEFASLDLGDYEEACMDGNTAPFGWTILLIEPHRFFSVHQHPNIEIGFVLRGAVYENRLLAQPDEMLADPLALPDSGFPKLFRVNKYTDGAVFSNARYSVHQSYTMDEGVVLLLFWTGKHVNLSDDAASLWSVQRCQNPLCPLGDQDPTNFAAFAAAGARRARATAPAGTRRYSEGGPQATADQPGLRHANGRGLATGGETWIVEASAGGVVETSAGGETWIVETSTGGETWLVETSAAAASA